MSILRHKIPRVYLVINNVRKLWLSHPQYARTHYQTLGIGNAASKAEIKRAYYDLSMKYHPDKDKGNEDKFRDITTGNISNVNIMLTLYINNMIDK